MNEELSSTDMNLQTAFGRILSAENFGEVGNDIAEMIYEHGLKREIFEDLLKQHGVKTTEHIKHEILDLILAYINLVLDDNFLTTAEADNVSFLKRFFKVKEGDFYSDKYYEVEKLLDRQFGHMYQNNKINTDEALQKVELQKLFDLGYDQFLKLVDKAVKSALNRGANIDELDTYLKQL